MYLLTMDHHVPFKNGKKDDVATGDFIYPKLIFAYADTFFFFLDQGSRLHILNSEYHIE